MMVCFQHVFEYFTERTPRSHFEQRETSLVWNYKYAGTLLVGHCSVQAISTFPLVPHHFAFSYYYGFRC